ncbi:MAG: thiamine pyrophosphate-dependent dehydrogenase E1 component subunit alpha [Gemmatimonadota bacterium]
MKRYPAYDPPEYVAWRPDDALLDEYRSTITARRDRRREIEALDPEARLSLYRGLLRFRLHDIALQRWVKQGVISKAWLGTGEEAVTIGAVHALRRTGAGRDVVGPMIRNAGACHEMGMPVEDMLRGYLATADSPTRGRDLHVGDLERGIVSPISMVGGLASVMNGFALAFRRSPGSRVALTWVGDGATKHGEVHEAFNFAAVQSLPIIFVIQNNQVALGTRFEQHQRAPDFRGWGAAYGVPLSSVDGNHVLDVYAATRLAAEMCRAGNGPVLIEATTFRMGGHATHDVQEARRTFPAEWFERWGRRDPIGSYEEYLARDERELDPTPSAAGEIDEDSTREGRNRAQLEREEERVIREIEAAAAAAIRSRDRCMPSPDQVEEGVYAAGESGA